MPVVAPVLERYVWTDADFARMSWHDVLVHAFVELSSAGELVFDLDYIVKWETPAQRGESFSFWICPATLVFHAARLERLRCEDRNGQLGIHELVREGAAGSREARWTFSCHTDDLVTLVASGFTQYLRAEPVLSPRQHLSAAERGGISFERRTPQGAAR